MPKRKQYRKPQQQDVACNPCDKFKLNDLAGLNAENQDRISYDAKNIDRERSKNNLFIHGLDEKNSPVINNKKYDIPLENRVINLIKKVGATIVHDAVPEEKKSKKKGEKTHESVVAEGIIFQLSHPLAMKLLEEDGLLDENGKIRKDKHLRPGMKTYRYFEKTYLFACRKWGAEKIVGAYIHMDEYTPHMHLYVVPIDKKLKRYGGKVLMDADGRPKERYTLNAKGIFSDINIGLLWEEHANEVREFGAKPATGLNEKGATDTYDEVASMEGRLKTVNKQLEEMEEEAEELDRQIADKLAELQKLEELKTEIVNTASKYSNYIKFAKKTKNNIIDQLQRILSVCGHPEWTVFDYRFDENPDNGDVFKIVYYVSKELDKSSVLKVVPEDVNSLNKTLKALADFVWVNKKSIKTVKDIPIKKTRKLGLSM